MRRAHHQHHPRCLALTWRPLLFAFILLTRPSPGTTKSLPRSPISSIAAEVCKPAVHASSPLPPCADIETIEALCYPNGTTPLFLEAHAQCMCRGSYFSEWTACRHCLFLHGQLSERDLAFYLSIAATASTALCAFLDAPSASYPAPTAMFKDLFTSAEESLSRPTTGAATPVDAAKGNTDVGLYFTASGATLGPGPITGSAMSATGTGGLVLATGRPSLSSRTTSSLVAVATPPPRTPVAGNSGANGTGAAAAADSGGALRWPMWTGWAFGLVAGAAVFAVVC